MALSDKVRKNIVLMKEYCSTFNLKIIYDAQTLKRWEKARGAMLGAAFVGNDVNEPPILWIAPDPDGCLYIEQDEDLLQPKEPAVTELEEDLLRVAVNNKRPIHPTS